MTMKNITVQSFERRLEDMRADFYHTVKYTYEKEALLNVKRDDTPTSDRYLIRAMRFQEGMPFYSNVIMLLSQIKVNEKSVSLEEYKAVFSKKPTIEVYDNKYKDFGTELQELTLRFYDKAKKIIKVGSVEIL
ncbi:MAG: hypothetical protein ACREBF_04940 [Candidatus Micrarchaeales archaeon]